MKQVLKGALAAAALPFAALPLALGGGAPAGAAVLTPEGPATVLTHGPAPWDMPQYLQGAGCEAPRNCQEVLYWWIISTTTYEIGVNENLTNLDYAINRADGPKIVYAFSGGARIATAWLTERAEDSDVAADDLSFLLIGNGTRKYGGASTWTLGDAITAPPTRYAVIDVAREYDPVADFPTNPFNLLATANALAAFNIVHMNYRDVDLDDPDNYVWTEGNTTYVFVPTDYLPLLQPLRNLGLHELADQWEAPLRAIIDSAYSRPYLPAEPQGEEGTDAVKSLSDESSSTAVTTLEIGSDAAASKVSDESDQAGGTVETGEAPVSEEPTPEPTGGVPDAESTDSETSDDAESTDAETSDAESTDTETSDAESTDTETSDADSEASDADSADTEQAGDTDEASDDALEGGGEDSAESDKPAGPKHRAPLNGTKKTAAGSRTDSTGADSSSDAGDSDAGASDDKSDKASDNDTSS
ncbi:putative PPE family protein PPE42 [Mycolicibacterium vanbaalenii]|uniref:Putative PPE family protein PPE42 n=1 Tax=Mycolicibacterium vanbaalenii TaxID=110539 RepID=A0A5S9PQP2_MYCVN|nr:PE-PPE domain-containing protein [Mycolicibacterium vanbaalenii]CAA0106925.1 putative PPE family protein PPE42 [Mycolicibacterium vanbaalenii]